MKYKVALLALLLLATTVKAETKSTFYHAPPGVVFQAALAGAQQQGDVTASDEKAGTISFAVRQSHREASCEILVSASNEGQTVVMLKVEPKSSKLGTWNETPVIAKRLFKSIDKQLKSPPTSP